MWHTQHKQTQFDINGNIVYSVKIESSLSLKQMKLVVTGKHNNISSKIKLCWKVFFSTYFPKSFFQYWGAVKSDRWQAGVDDDMMSWADMAGWLAHNWDGPGAGDRDRGGGPRTEHPASTALPCPAQARITPQYSGTQAAGTQTLLHWFLTFPI